MDWFSSVIQSPRPFVFNALAGLFLLALLVGFFWSPQWSWKPMLFAFLGAGLAAFVGNFEYIETFKASSSGIEARTRAVIREAESTIDKVRELAAANGALLIQMIASSGRLGGPSTPVEDDAQKAQVLEMLRAAGVSQSRIDEVAHADRRWVIVDYVNGILAGPARRMAAQPNTPERANAWNAIYDGFNKGLDRPGPDELRSILERLDLLDDTTRELIEDYRYYLATGQHRRPNVWANRGSWQQ